MLATIKKKMSSRAFSSDENGSIIVFVLVVFSAMFLVGGTAVDLARHENLRSSLQYNLDRAVLAAASLKQTQDPNVVVQDYMSKVTTIESFSVQVDSTVAVNARTVSAEATAVLDTWFLSMAGINQMPIKAVSKSEEKIPNLEIALVLDVSGSMSSNSKLTNLKVAAKEFVTTMLENTEPDTVAISIVPFNHNVAPSTLMYDAISVNEVHDYSTCLDFEDSAFGSTKIDPAVLQKQAIYTASKGDWQDLDEGRITCYSNDYFEILPYSDNETALHEKIDDLEADGWTGGHMGIKWGAAMLNPAFQSVATHLIDEDVVDDGFAGLPVAYNDAQTKKVIIMMGDGANTYEFRMGNGYDSGPSDLFTVSYVGQVFEYAYRKNKVWRTSTSESKCSSSKWVCVYSTENVTDYYLRKTSNNRYLDIERDDWITESEFNNLPTTLTGWTGTEQLSWGQAWGHMPADWYDDEIGTNTYSDLVSGTGRNSSESDTAMASICSAAADDGIIIYSIGFETDNSTSQKLEDCASSASHYYDATGTQISTVFAAIATSIQKLKLTQ